MAASKEFTTLEEFEAQNEIRIKQFNEVRKMVLNLAGMDTENDNNLTLTGSRRSGLAYPESDFDAAFVRETIEELEAVRQKFIEAKFPTEWSLKSETTKGGLPWVPISNVTFGADSKDPLITKLDVTFRTKKNHELIQSHVEKQLPLFFSNKESKFAYITQIRKYHLDGDIKTYNLQKNWLRIL
jgi:hypothetical protein